MPYRATSSPRLRPHLGFYRRDNYSDLGGYYKGKFEAYQRTYVLTDFKGVFVRYLYSFLSANLRPDLLAQVQTSAMSYIRLPMLNEYQISTPPSQAEQKKVADCLSSLDELIAAQAHKVDVLKTHKKGLMQQLFSCDGESQPRVRLPDFLDADDWNENYLGRLVVIRSGNSPSRHELRHQGIYPFVKVEDLNNCEKYQKASREYSDEKNGLIPKGSVIFPKRGAAIALNKIRLSNRELIMDTNMMAFTPVDGCLPEFLFYLICQIGLNKIADSSTIPQINNKHIIPFAVLIPEIEEQQRIADCLTSLDELITAATQELGTLKTHKKGLMQQLFPVTEGA